eukprot:Protomagalhaensia_wolfi_Nauph_80__1700@NODE_2055_length_1229_cov_1667_239496_g1519_i2_p1_GENE_NODE_2055_length_1229_cov_1667_239496_g1519_i2NODE_2055_length_1229_cov_1667_239496_g1519_i2_p1_ORF_typecomplete_len259_score25_48_NODE_2055_length_1229_cov_1667_239496_g1519_i22841060
MSTNENGKVSNKPHEPSQVKLDDLWGGRPLAPAPSSPPPRPTLIPSQEMTLSQPDNPLPCLGSQETLNPSSSSGAGRRSVQQLTMRRYCSQNRVGRSLSQKSTILPRRLESQWSGRPFVGESEGESEGASEVPRLRLSATRCSAASTCHTLRHQRPPDTDDYTTPVPVRRRTVAANPAPAAAVHPSARQHRRWSTPVPGFLPPVQENLARIGITPQANEAHPSAGTELSLEQPVNRKRQRDPSSSGGSRKLHCKMTFS